jgi:hypothetical protein
MKSDQVSALLMQNINSNINDQLAKQFAESAMRDADFIDPILNDLMQAGIIKDKKNVSFELNNEKFIVNKVQQSKEIQRKFRDKYIKGSKEHISYSIANGATHTDINVDR